MNSVRFLPKLRKMLCALALLSVSSGAYSYTASDFQSTPVFLSDTTDPFVMISLSVELTQQAEAFTGAQQTYANGTYCPGRTSGRSVCYINTEEYIGYFDPDKCYQYVTKTGTVYDGVAVYDTDDITQSALGPELSTNRTTDYFRASGFATNRQCSGATFSGNFMNWATMTALDEFRYAMTGGARLVDTAGASAQTLLTRTHRYGDWDFVDKRISSTGQTTGGVTFTTNPSNVTPFSVSELRIINDNGNNGNRVLFRDSGDNTLAELSVIVEVCDNSISLEDNCVEYSDGSNTWYKPEGVMQNNSMNMRYALTSYSAENGNNRNGGVLRSNAKYVGYYRPLEDGGIELNPEAEINESGQYVFHPDLAKLTSDGEDLGGVNNSGALNYINLFGLGPDRYKGNDPVSELYYEGLRYIMGLDPTPEYSQNSGGITALSNDEKDNFPVIYQEWDDPILNACQANYIVGVGDQFSHRDGNLPGSVYHPTGTPTLPSNGADVGFNVTSLTNAVGVLEGMGSTIGNGEATGRENTYYGAGMAHWAATQDVRSGLGGATAFDGDQHVRTFYVDTQEFNGNPPTREENPLWLAAKYGGFEDFDGDGDPNNGVVPTGSTPATCGSTSEWDADGDCEPEAYTLASQPANLIAGLENAFNEISKSLRASSAAGVVSNTSDGEGIVVQALYKSEHTDATNKFVEWVGLVQALYVDSFNNIREDTDGNGQLTNADAVVTFRIDLQNEEALVDLYSTTDGGETLSALPTATDLSIEELNPIWDVRAELASISDYVTQRTYDQAPVGGGRYIFTAIDSDQDGIALSTDMAPFTSDTFPNMSAGPSNNFRYLGLDSSNGDSAENIVNYIRGDESIPGYRSRTVDFDGSGTAKPWLLGDVVSSSPAVVGAPKPEVDFNSIYGDESYLGFAQQYRDRRQMVYFGANDGMFHAVNAGFYNLSTGAYTLTQGVEPAHPLGAELWAYVPYNALPHLQWLTELSYPHVHYVDGIPQVFNVNIFPNDAEHPNGWGTILVVGMRFGGGDFTLDPDSDTDVDFSDDITLRSSYMVFDITNPETEPELIAEISHPSMGYSTTRPAIAFSRPSDANGDFGNQGNDWYLVFGSGPYGSDAAARTAALTDGVSDQTAKIFAFDLNSKSFVSYSGNEYLEIPAAVNGFAGDFVSADWDLDFETDTIYFGTVTGSAGSPGGSLFRLRLGSTSTLLSSATTQPVLSSVNAPFSGQPHVMQIAGENWLFTGSGRFYVAEDNLSSGQQSYYGLLDPDSSGSSIDDHDLADVSDIQVEFVDGKLNGPIYDSTGVAPTISINGSAVTPTTFSELRRAIQTGPGWKIDFTNLNSKHVGRSDNTGLTVGFTEYESTGAACEAFGDSYLNLVHFGTGTAAPFAATNNKTTNVTIGADIADRRLSAGLGLVRDVNFDSGRIVLQGGMGDLNVEEPGTATAQTGRASWREIIINW